MLKQTIEYMRDPQAYVASLLREAVEDAGWTPPSSAGGMT